MSKVLNILVGFIYIFGYNWQSRVFFSVHIHYFLLLVAKIYLNYLVSSGRC